MNPNSQETPIHLPEPTVETLPGQSVEKQPNQAESQPVVAQPSPGSMHIPTMVPLPAIPAVPLTQPTDTSPQDNPLIARDDADLIEKEWVNRAKAIVEQTRDDPHLQSDELSVFKADYMKKRYNRNVKLSK
jgi:hypothetical protein